MRLSIEYVQYWGRERETQGHSGQEKTRALNVAHLALRNIGTPGNSRQQLITWPKALQTLPIEISSGNYAGNPDPPFSSAKLYNALKSQRKALEELCIRCNVSRLGVVDSP